MDMTDTFKQHGRSLTSPPEDAAEIVPSDAAVLACVTRALYVGGGGDLRVRMLGGAVVTLANVPTGALVPIRVTRLFATGTSASGVVGFW
jgi:hypothetical protein